MDVEKVAVIIPFYKTELSGYEKIALKQCQKVLHNYPIIAIRPDSLVLPEEIKEFPFFNVLCFDDGFFKDVQGYNQLMLSDIFYKALLGYEYILIYQLDAFVFKDELNYWCSQDIDYIGAPWIPARNYTNTIKKVISRASQHFARRYNLKKNGLPRQKQFDGAVGNGGFSLRRVKLFYELCVAYREKIADYNKLTTHHYNEDVFWGIELNRKRKVLNIPDYVYALKFAFEIAPEQSYNINNRQLPFGCHAWDLSIDFWRPFFKQYGYII
jgi:hypothetical protein